ncbi:MAG: DUF2334 domain-containing protein [Gammaproteobacteria bacterium]|nr:DUF2334 domain-containing protein [Gammaproteobacteria bacterium]
MAMWLDPVHQVLDNKSTVVQCYFRDDDIGWDNSRLFEMLNIFRRYHVPIDLAVIPSCVSSELAKQLIARVDNEHQRIGFHQHGYRHANHQMTGRKSEFGDERSLHDQLEDIENGCLILKACFHEYLQPIFTPPWNRCSKQTLSALETLGFKILSRDISATLLDTESIREIPVHLDWFAKHKGTRLDFNHLGEQLASFFHQYNSVGVMLHHQLMDHKERLRLAELLNMFACHSRVEFILMQETLE